MITIPFLHVKTLHLSIIIGIILSGISLVIGVNAYAINCTYCPMIPSSYIPPSLASINATLDANTHGNIVITGKIYKLFSNVIVLKIQNPQGNLTAISQLQPASDGAFSLSILPSSALWSVKGNYTITISSDSQELGKTEFYFNGTIPLSTSSAHGINTLGIPLSPLREFKSGIEAKDVKCNSGLSLVIKAEDGSPACVTHDTVQKLIKRGWGSYATNFTQQQLPSILPSLTKKITGLENDSGIVTLENKTYYFETPNYTKTANSDPKKLLFFHDVVFTTVPPFGEKFLIDGCEREYYWTDAKFSDGTSELLHVYVDSQPCPVHFPQNYFSTHTNPQAGLTFYDGKMKLLVSTDNQSSSALRLYLSVNPPIIQSGQKIGIDISLNNTLSRMVTIPHQDNWALQSLSLRPCSYGPIGIAILNGYYTADNMTQGNRLPFYEEDLPYLCPAYFANGYVFQPQSSQERDECGPDFNCLGLNDVSDHISTDGFWEAKGHFHPYSSGTYTVVGGDEWGHIAIQHFVVTNSTKR